MELDLIQVRESSPGTFCLGKKCRVKEVKVNETFGTFQKPWIIVPSVCTCLFFFPQWMWPWMLTQPTSTSSFPRTWKLSVVGFSSRRRGPDLRDSAVQLVSWDSLCSPLAAITGRWTWGPATNGMWAFAKNLCVDEGRLNWLQILASGLCVWEMEMPSPPTLCLPLFSRSAPGYIEWGFSWIWILGLFPFITLVMDPIFLHSLKFLLGSHCVHFFLLHIRLRMIKASWESVLWWV